MEQLLAGLRAAAEVTRLRILALCAEGELTVTELTYILSQSQPRVSRHLKLLCEASLLDRCREGTSVFHRTVQSGPPGDLVRALVAQISDDDPERRLDRERFAEIGRRRAEAAAAYFGRNAAEWDAIRSLHVDEAEVERALLDLVPPGRFGELLDIGTGTGRIVELLAPRVERATGVDTSREMLAVARDKLARAGHGNCALRQADMYRLPFESASIDLVVIHQVLHFAEDPAAVVAEAARVLRPGGRLIVADFARHDLAYLQQDHAHRRLGFGESEVIGWCRAQRLDVGSVRNLSGDPLTVTVWMADRPAATVETRVAAAGRAARARATIQNEVAS